jgi:hypothetical protein
MRTPRVFAFVFCILFVSAALVRAMPPFYLVNIEQIGTRHANGLVTPIYALAVNNPGSVEYENAELFRVFGPFALDGTVYTRYPDDHRLWYSVLFRRPETADEIAAFEQELGQLDSPLDSRFAEKREPDQPEVTLPEPFDQLTNDNLAIVQSVIVYRNGTLRVFFNDELATIGKIETLLEIVEANHTIIVRQTSGSW